MHLFIRRRERSVCSTLATSRLSSENVFISSCRYWRSLTYATVIYKHTLRISEEKKVKFYQSRKSHNTSLNASHWPKTYCINVWCSRLHKWCFHRQDSASLIGTFSVEESQKMWLKFTQPCAKVPSKTRSTSLEIKTFISKCSQICQSAVLEVNAVITVVRVEKTMRWLLSTLTLSNNWSRWVSQSLLQGLLYASTVMTLSLRWKLCC